MRRSAKAAACLIGLAAFPTGSFAAPGATGCALNFPPAVACFDPNTAAQAWRVVGRDPHALDDAVMRGVFQKAGCVSFGDVADPGEPISLAAATDVLLRDGAVRVLYLTVRNARVGGSAVWVAAPYITGECEPMRRVQ